MPMALVNLLEIEMYVGIRVCVTMDATTQREPCRISWLCLEISAVAQYCACVEALSAKLSGTTAAVVCADSNSERSPAPLVHTLQPSQ